MTDDDSRISDVQDFVTKKGSIGLILQLDADNRKIKSEFEDGLSISGRTLTERLNEAKESGLIKEVTIGAGDHPRSTPYVLTGRGEDLQKLIREMGLDEIQERFVRYMKKLDAAVGELQEQIEDNFGKQDAWKASEEEKREMMRKLEQDPEIDTDQVNTGFTEEKDDE